jgi:hypothetical protein
MMGCPRRFWITLYAARLLATVPFRTAKKEELWLLVLIDRRDIQARQVLVQSVVDVEEQ